MKVPLQEIRAYQKCVIPACGRTYDVSEVATECGSCGNLLDVAYDWEPEMFKGYKELLKQRRGEDGIFNESGVWRYRELFPFWSGGAPMEDVMVSLDGLEGNTKPVNATRVAAYVGMEPKNLYLQFEGANPTGSFKDNGMAAGYTHAKMNGRRNVLCASTGNTSASLAAFAANEGDFTAYVLVGKGRIAKGKLSQTLAYGAKVLEIEGGDFDDSMKLAKQVAASVPGTYLLNSVNSYRLEGQKTIMFRMLSELGWEAPDYVVVPGGNLGNTSAFGKAFDEAFYLGLIDRKPRIVVVNAEGSNTLHTLYNGHFMGVPLKWNGGNVDDRLISDYYNYLDDAGIKAHTKASAIEINRPENLKKALRTLEHTGGMVTQASDEEMLDAAAVLGTSGLFECDIASAASVAGIKKLVADGQIPRDARVVGIITGRNKDAYATIEYHSDMHAYSNHPTDVANDPDAVRRLMA